jgi:PAS domain S-box-containing protein
MKPAATFGDRTKSSVKAKTHPDSDRIFALRRYVVSFLLIIIYVLADRSTVFLQIWTGISAWYPPTGIALAMLIGMGPGYAPALILAGLIAGKLNYHVATFSYTFLLASPMIIVGYSGAAVILRRVVKVDWRLRSIRDVLLLLFVALPTSGMVAFAGTYFLVLDHAVPPNEYLKAALSWWVGDAVAIACFTPFCLVFLMPALRRFVGFLQTPADLESASDQGLQPTHWAGRLAESVALAMVGLGSLWVVLGPHSKDNHDLFYIFFLPIIWIAVRRGLRGAAAGILVLDLGIVVSLRVSASDPSHFAVLQFLMLILSLTGLVLGALISQRDRTEKSLSREEERIRLLLESVGEAVYGMDIYGNCTFCNPAFLRMLGYESQQALLGRNIHDIIHHTRLDGTPFPWGECALHDVLKTGKTFHAIDEAMWRSDGTKVRVELWSHALNQNGKVLGAVITLVDITERLRTEESLRQAKESAEAANSAKSDFLANMSHELRTPMNGILGMAALAMDTDLSTEQREYLSMVKSSGESLLSLLNDILDLSKIEAGKLELEFADFSIEDSVEQTLQSVSTLAQGKSLELVWNVEGVPTLVRGDHLRLRQVLINLVGNALKFTKEGGVAVLAKLIPDAGTGVRVRFTISDTGIGIPLDKQRKIFEAFSQADMSTSRRYGGTGLGLSISERLVTLMNGQISLESEVGHGSQFHFEIPFLPSTTAASSNAAHPPVLGRGRILIADSNIVNAALLKRVAHEWGVESINESSVSGALERFKEMSHGGSIIFAALISMDLGNAGGLVLASAIAKSPVAPNPVILMLSTPLGAADSRECKRMGISTILKPIRRAALVQALFGEQPIPATEPISAVLTAGNSKTDVLRILLAEDNVVNQHLISRILQKMGHLVVVASDGAKALNLMSEQNFDLIAMDMQMPIMDGIETTQRIRRKEKGTPQHMPIMAITANAFDDDRRRCYEAGMDGYVVKPVTAQAIRDEMSRVLLGLKARNEKLAVEIETR